MRPSTNPSGNARTSLAPKDPGPEALEPFVAPEAPTTLTPMGQDIWYKVWNWGQRAFDTVSDVFVIERYCVAHEMAAAAKAQMGTNFITLGSTGQERLNPLHTIVKDAHAEMAKCEAVLGLNPEARVRLGIAKVEAEDKFSAFLKRQEKAKK